MAVEQRRRGWGEGAVYQRADGRWEGQVRLPDGTRKHLYATSRRKAEQKVFAYRKALEEGDAVRGRPQTVTAFLDEWLKATKGTVRPKTFLSYELNVRRLEPHFRRLKITDLTPTAVQAVYGKLRSRGLSARSVEQAHAVLHRAFEQATRWRLVTRNPVAYASPPRPERREMKTLTAEQLRQLIDSTRGQRLHALWTLCGTTGVRLGEALGLKWEDVDLDQGRVVIRRVLQRQAGAGLVFAEPKTSKSRRTVHLSEIAVRALREHIEVQNAYRNAASSWVESGLVFTSVQGGPMEGTVANESLSRALNAAGIPRIRVHDLRHTAASLALEAGVHPKVVQEMLGHSTIVLTLDTYSHVTPALHREAALSLNSLLEGVRDHA